MQPGSVRSSAGAGRGRVSLETFLLALAVALVAAVGAIPGDGTSGLDNDLFAVHSFMSAGVRILEPNR